MNNTIGVSAFSLRHELGPVAVAARDEDGGSVVQRVGDWARSLPLGELPHRIASAFGVHAFEIPDVYLIDSSDDELAALREALTIEKVSLTAVTLDTRFISASADWRSSDLREIESIMTTAAWLGASAIRVTLLAATDMFDSEDFDPSAPSELDADYETIVAALQQMASVAERHGLRLLIENHCRLTSTPEAITALLDDVGPGLGLLLDTGNFEPVMSESINAYLQERAPEDVPSAAAVYSAVERLLPRAERVHLKSYGYHDDGRSRVYDVDRMLDIIRASGYAGPITIEHESEMAPDVDADIARVITRIKELS